MTKRRLLLGLAAALLLFVAFEMLRLVGPGGEHKITRYADLAAARADGAFGRGWLPKLLPPGSANIAESHGVQPGIGTGTFTFPSYQLEAYKTEVRQFGSAILRETSTTTNIIYYDEWSRFELEMTPDPQKASAMLGTWSVQRKR